MTRRDRTPAQQRTAWLLGLLSGTVGLVALYAVLAARAPGDTAAGALTGGLTVLLLACVARWRTVRRGRTASTATRIGGGALDERDDHVLTRTLAVVGYVAILASGLASAAVMVGADAATVVRALPFALLGTLGITFVVVDRRS
ncbi:hypothetical protein [Cellulomonas cellasea]|uniref:Uncharacterized protein n=1 Tax=Cellulomonas cellasea TaxID=43670 RepID=A0A7W4Y9X7_9CELL|nr:hypothetical protein [Cellulomonas cellasea]MBB2921172.1 hypothetical protein [Cellulomonas cellasea]